jgi:hypothetical protein
MSSVAAQVRGQVNDRPVFIPGAVEPEGKARWAPMTQSVGGRGSWRSPPMDRREKPAAPFGSGQRIIDFTSAKCPPGFDAQRDRRRLPVSAGGIPLITADMVDKIAAVALRPAARPVPCVPALAS